MQKRGICLAARNENKTRSLGWQIPGILGSNIFFIKKKIKGGGEGGRCMWILKYCVVACFYVDSSVLMLYENWKRVNLCVWGRKSMGTWWRWQSLLSPISFVGPTSLRLERARRAGQPKAGSLHLSGTGGVLHQHLPHSRSQSSTLFLWACLMAAWLAPAAGGAHNSDAT